MFDIAVVHLLFQGCKPITMALLVPADAHEKLQYLINSAILTDKG